MSCQFIRWSKAYPLTTEFWDQVPPARPGVYRIRVFDSRGRPVPIASLRGTDQAGILHIGQSRNVRERIKQFYRSAKEGPKNHHAGNEFSLWGFAKTFPLERLRFDYLLTGTLAQAKKHERLFHEHYRERHLDRPPLDGASGQANSSNQP